MKTEKIGLKVLFTFGVLMLLLCLTILFWQLLVQHDTEQAASWTNAFGTLSTVLITLWITVNNDIKNKDKLYKEFKAEIKRLKSLESNLTSARNYDPDTYLKKQSRLGSAVTWFQNWHEHIPELIELKKVLEDYHQPDQGLDDFIHYIENGNQRELNDQLAKPLLCLKSIIDLKENQLKAMQ